MLWTRRRRDFSARHAVPVFVAASLPLWYACWRTKVRGRADGVVTVGALMLASLLLMFAGSLLQAEGFTPARLSLAVQNQ